MALQTGNWGWKHIAGRKCCASEWRTARASCTTYIGSLQRVTCNATRAGLCFDFRALAKQLERQPWRTHSLIHPTARFPKSSIDSTCDMEKRRFDEECSKLLLDLATHLVSNQWVHMPDIDIYTLGLPCTPWS